MKHILHMVLLGIFILLLFLGYYLFITKPQLLPQIEMKAYWMGLHRKSNLEYLYFGIPGDLQNSRLVRTFRVKAGIPGERPTPLPQKLGKKYWLITAKSETKDNPETAPYFLALNIPISETEPYGPTPYLECDGQCNWVLPGTFGLHGVNGDESRLSDGNAGSSGCIRHRDEDITYLYNVLDPKKGELRYYIEDI